MVEHHDWLNEPPILLNQPSITLAKAEQTRDYHLALLMLTQACNFRQLHCHYEVDHFSSHLNVCKTGIFPSIYQENEFPARRKNRPYPKPMFGFIVLWHQYWIAWSRRDAEDDNQYLDQAVALEDTPDFSSWKIEYY